jgi:hypothetical protein
VWGLAGFEGGGLDEEDGWSVVVAEDRTHLFFDCPAAQAIWRRARVHLNMRSFDDL